MDSFSLAIHLVWPLLLASSLDSINHSELMNVSFCWLANSGMSLCRSSWENVAESNMSCSSYLYGL